MEENKIRQNMIDKLIKGLGVSLAKTPLVLLLKNKTDYSQKRVLHGNFFLCVFCCLSFVTEGSTQNTGNVCFFACFCSIENQKIIIEWQLNLTYSKIIIVNLVQQVFIILKDTIASFRMDNLSFNGNLGSSNYNNTEKPRLSIEQCTFYAKQVDDIILIRSNQLNTVIVTILQVLQFILQQHFYNQM